MDPGSSERNEEDFQKDLAAFSALIDSDDDFEAECLSQEARKSDSNSPSAANDENDRDEVDYDAISAMLHDSDNDENTKEDVPERSTDEPSQAEIDNFLGGDDSDVEESELESSQEPIVAASGPANLSAEDVMSAVLDESSSEVKVTDEQPDQQIEQVQPEPDPVVDDFMEEYRKMEAMMEMMRAKKEQLELEQQGIVSNTVVSPSQTKHVPTPMIKPNMAGSDSSRKSLSNTTVVKNTMNSGKADNTGKLGGGENPILKDLNVDIFSSQTETANKENSITKPGRPRKRPGMTLDVEEIKPTNFYSKAPAAGLSLADDDDSDWEEMDGEKPNNLSKPGEDVKRLLKTKADGSRTAHTPRRDHNAPQQNRGLANKPGSVSKAGDLLKKVSDDNSWKDPFSGMRIIKPLISEATLTSRMEGRRLLKISKINSHSRKSLLDVDWVTIGCIIGKSETRTSAKGGQYMIWTLSDLEDCDNSVKVFLFGDTYKQLWKESVGTVIGILNPSFMANEDKNNTGVALTIDNWQKVMKLGASRDYGVCKATTKSGKTCFNFLNRSQGEYCSYHVQNAYRKACSKRSELQAGYSGPKPKSFMNKIFNKKNDTYYYGGQMFTMEGNTGNKKAVSASSIRNATQGAGAGGKKNAFSLTSMKTNTDGRLPADMDASKATDNGLQEMLAVPTRGSMNLLRHLSKEEKKETEKREGQKMFPVKPSDLIKQTQREFLQQKNARKQKENALGDVPQLGRGCQPGMEISFDMPSKTTRGGKTMSKAQAIAKIRAPLTKADPNAVKKTKTSPDVQNRIKKRLREEMEPPAPLESSARAAKRPKILGGLDLQSEEVQKLLKAGSSHKGAVAEIEAEREEKYFAGLEKQETMEQKMLSVMEIKVKVVTCKLCQYTVDGKANQTCLDQHRHALVESKSAKKFFKCAACGERTSSFDKYPNHACVKCGGGGFVKTSMWKERKGPLLESEKLLLRGEERKFVNS